jgi:large subunit ribosomal protein L30
MVALTVVQRRSSNGSNKRQLDTLRSLGLRRIGHTVQVDDCPQTRGMLHAVRHLVEIQDGPGSAKRAPAAKGAAKKSAAGVEVTAEASR